VALFYKENFLEGIFEFIETFMQTIQDTANANLAIAPWLICSVLLLAGFNLPISEDLMIFMTAILSAKNPDHMPYLFLGLFAGAYFSDLICYWLGRLLGPKLFQIKLFKNMITPELLEKIKGFYDRFGMGVLIIGRFIPFGVRNGLFITAGLGKSHFGKFAFADFVATLISVSVYFGLYYNYGEAMIEVIKKGNTFIFSIFIISVIVFLVYKKKKQSSAQN
jgi:membrane-associated protein